MISLLVFAEMLSDDDGNDAALNAELTSRMNFGGGFLPKTGGPSQEMPQHRNKKEASHAICYAIIRYVCLQPLLSCLRGFNPAILLPRCTFVASNFGVFNSTFVAAWFPLGCILKAYCMPIPCPAFPILAHEVPLFLECTITSKNFVVRSHIGFQRHC